MKIIEQLTEDTYIIKVSDEDKRPYSEFSICHDYVGFKGSNFLSTEGNVKLWGKNQVCANGITIPNYVQVSIRKMIQVVLPKLNSHKYLQLDHLVDSKGEPSYNYHNQIIHYWDDIKKQEMVAVCLTKETEFNHITLQFFNKFVKPNL